MWTWTVDYLTEIGVWGVAIHDEFWDTEAEAKDNIRNRFKMEPPAIPGLPENAEIIDVFVFYVSLRD